jgi:ABC-2 type transport system ATP-binding protein
MLHISDFSKSYSGFLVLSMKEIVFPAGVHWIKGENGSGKSTFFRSLAGLIPCEGQVTVDKVTDLHRHPVSYRKLVNYGEAEPLYPGFLTARDLIRFAGNAKSSTLAQQQDLIRRFGIDAYLTNPCGACSSGMLKKISLAIAFLGSPRVIILDEPLITLDEPARNALTTLIEEHVRREVIFLISSHQVIESESLAVQSVYTIRNKTLFNVS